MIAVFISLDATADESAPTDDDDEKGFEIAIVHAAMFFFLCLRFSSVVFPLLLLAKAGRGVREDEGW